MNEMRKLMEAVEQINEAYSVDVRQVTNELYQMMDDGQIDSRIVADAALKYMSESDVADMIQANDWIQYDDDELDEEIKDGTSGDKPFIDLSGPDGNAFVLMGHAKGYAKDLGLDGSAIVEEMMESDYEHLLEVFNKYFGEYVDLYRGQTNENINETDGSMSPEDYLRELRSLLFELANLAANQQFYLRHSNPEFSAIAKEVEDQADRLRELIHSKL